MSKCPEPQPDIPLSHKTPGHSVAQSGVVDEGLKFSLVADVYSTYSLVHMTMVDIARQRFEWAMKDVVNPCTAESIFVIEPVDTVTLREALSSVGEVMWPLADEKGSLFVVAAGYIVCVSITQMFGHRELRVTVHADRDSIERVKDKVKRALGDLVADCQGAVKIEVGWYFMSGEKEVSHRSLTEEIHEVVHQEAYPYLGDLQAFVKGYLESQSSVLLLMGTQGTGKTRLIRYIVQEAGRSRDDVLNVVYTSDMRALSEESMFIEFKCGEYEMMVLEDIDDLLVSRKNGNPVVHKFLASSDGFVAARHKKIILSTNLFVNDIDEALVRPGRCYACVETQLLKSNEASALARRLGKDVSFDENVTVAEVYDAVLKTSCGVKHENKLGFKRS